MEPVEFYFIFHPPARWCDVRSGKASISQMLGHVEAMGYTEDDTWFFYDPGRSQTSLRITHLYDEVEMIMSEKFTVAQEIIKIEGGGSFSFPLHFSMNCVTQCAALIGARAFTPKGFRKRLLLEKGVIIHGPLRRSRI